MNKKTILASHLALRFYKHYGWSEDEVKSYLVRGNLRFFDDENPYWVGEVGSVFDVDKLIEGVGDIYDWENQKIEDAEKRKFLTGYNW